MMHMHGYVGTAACLSFVLSAVVGCAAPAPGTTGQPERSIGPTAMPSATVARSSTDPSPRLAIRPSDGLYVLPQPIPIGPLGSVLQSEPLEAPVGVRAWAVLYRSTGFDGQPAAVSGVILAPDDVAPAGGRPILA